MEGVTYTGNYTTAGSQDGYNPYKYTTEAPFGAEPEYDWYTKMETEPMKMKGAVGMLMVVVGIIMFKN